MKQGFSLINAIILSSVTCMVLIRKVHKVGVKTEILKWGIIFCNIIYVSIYTLVRVI